MTEKISNRTPELERRLEYAKRIRKAVDYKGTADHEDHTANSQEAAGRGGV